MKPPLGGTPISDSPPSAKASTVSGRARPMPSRPAMRSWPSVRAMRPAAMNIAALAQACETSWTMPPIHAETPTAAGEVRTIGKIRNR